MNSGPSPKVSVIIPCFNRERYIAQTVDSVLSQTWQNLELIVVDDGCSDGSRAILESFGSRLEILQHPGRVNRGQSAAINLGLQHASGEYVAVLDSDDLFAPHKIERQVQFLMANPYLGLVYANGHYIDQDGVILHEFYGNGHRETSDPNRVLLDCYFLVPNNALVRRSAFERCGLFDEELRASQDHDMAIRLTEVVQVGYLPEHLFFYRRHLDSISYRNVKRRWLNGYKILLKAYRRYPYRLSAVLGRLAVLNFRLGQCYKEEQRYLLAGLMFLAAGITDPVRSLRVIIGREPVSGHH